MKIIVLLFSIFLVLVVSSSLLFFASAEQQENTKSGYNHWVLFNINKEGHAKVLSARAVSADTTPASPCAATPEQARRDPMTSKKSMRNKMIVVTYTKDHTTGEKCHVVVKDPRILWHDQAHPEHGESHFHGHVQKQDESSFAIVISADVSDLETIDLGSQHQDLSHRRHRIGLEHLRAADTLASNIDPTKLVLNTLQLVGTTANQRNMVFLSSGYTAAEQTKFNNDVQGVLDFLQTSSSTVSSMPYFRYFSNFNFFSVFHPSEQSGASHPKPAGSGVETDNILECSYGSTSSRILSCNRPRVLIMASYAPPDPSTSLTIVLVNDDTFGGTGSPGICSVYVGSKTNVVFIHEIGHAFADLSDEYSYDESESEQLDLINCHWDPVIDIPWVDWINASVLALPDPVCTYLNYYSPRPPGNCLMESEQFTLCEVCKEATVRTIYGQIGDNAPNGLNLAAPRFPSEHDTVIIKESENVTIWMNNRINDLTDSSGVFSSKWMLDDGSMTVLAENVSSLSIVPTSGSGAVAEWVHPAGAANYTVILEIIDHTSMLLPKKRTENSQNTSSRKSMKQHHTYNVRIILDADTSVECTIRNDTHGGQYCGACEPGYESECSLNVTAQPIAGIKDVSGDIPGLEGWLIGLGVGFIVLGAIAFFFTFKTMEQHAEENVGEILPLSPTLVVLRVVLMIFQVLLLLASTFVIMYAAYMFIVLSIFGRAMVLGICIVSCFTWFFSFVGFSGAYFNNRQVVFGSFILSIFFIALTLIFTGMLLHTQMNLDGDDDVFLQLRSEWQTVVKHDPETACKMQSYLYCSGFNSSCYTAPGATSDCPAQCEDANQIAFPCWPKVQDFVREHFYNAAVGGIVLAVFLVCIMVLSVIFGCGMKINRSRITRQRYKRAQEGRNTLSDNELTMLRNEFRKVDKDKTGQITRDQFAKFYSKTMGVAMNKDQLQEYFDTLDSDGSGTLSFEEFVKIYMPAVDVTTEMLEREKKAEQDRIDERNRLLSPQTQNVDPLAAQAEQDQRQHSRTHSNHRGSHDAGEFDDVVDAGVIGAGVRRKSGHQGIRRHSSDLADSQRQQNNNTIDGIPMAEQSPVEMNFMGNQQNNNNNSNNDLNAGAAGDSTMRNAEFVKQQQEEEHVDNNNNDEEEEEDDEHIVVVDDEHNNDQDGQQEEEAQNEGDDERLNESIRMRNMLREKTSASP